METESGRGSARADLVAGLLVASAIAWMVAVLVSGAPHGAVRVWDVRCDRVVDSIYYAMNSLPAIAALVLAAGIVASARSRFGVGCLCFVVLIAGLPLAGVFIDAMGFDACAD
ncbi:MAG: hypothetical protein ACSLFM_06035 [Tepidiformaceae bacterium]